MVQSISLAGVTIGVEVQSVTVNEGDGKAEICATKMSGNLLRTVTVILSTEDGTATSDLPRDITAITPEVDLDMARSRACTDIRIEDDNIVEEDETFRVVVSSADSSVDIMPSTTVVTIVDNDKVVIGLDREKYLGDGKDPFEVCGVLRNATTEKTLSTQFLIGEER